MTIRKMIGVDSPDDTTSTNFEARCPNCGDGGNKAIEVYAVVHSFRGALEMSVYKARCNICKCLFKVRARRRQFADA